MGGWGNEVMEENEREEQEEKENEVEDNRKRKEGRYISMQEERDN